MDRYRLAAFETVMGGTPRIWIGGILAYGVSTFLNGTIFSLMPQTLADGAVVFQSGV